MCDRCDKFMAEPHFMSFNGQLLTVCGSCWDHLYEVKRSIKAPDSQDDHLIYHKQDVSVLGPRRRPSKEIKPYRKSK